jgi:hypothetical protein
MIIADEATCYFLTNDYGMNSLSINSVYTRVYGFGDFKLLGNVTSNPKAFVAGDKLNPTGGGRSGGVARANGIVGYMEHPLTGGSESTRYYVAPGYIHTSVAIYRGSANTLSSCELAATIFPSPITGGLQLESFIICDDTNNIVRTNKHTGYLFERFATYPGFYGCGHSLDPDVGVYKVCDIFDTVTADGRSYLLFGSGAEQGVYDSFINNEASYIEGTVAIDITGPW